MKLEELLKTLPKTQEVSIRWRANDNWVGRCYQSEVWDFDPQFPQDREVTSVKTIIEICIEPTNT